MNAYNYSSYSSNQLLATAAILKKTDQKELIAHLDNCVRKTTTEEGATKIEEIIKIVEKINKS